MPSNYMDNLVSDNLVYQSCGRCEHPAHVRNKYTGQVVEVPCGTCNTCLLNKVNKNMLLCSIEESYHRYTYFVTLTYNEENVPIMKYQFVENVGDANLYNFYIDTPRLKRDGQLLFSDYHTEKYLNNLAVKTKLGKGRLTFLCYEDLQLYIKRVRKRLAALSPSPVRYYAVGEYGPKTFRCHWHILFYLDDERQAQNIIQICSDCWKFGFVDVSASLHSSASYLAGYVNNYSCVPRLFAHRGIRPKPFHSFHFGLSPFQADKEKIYEDPVKYLDEKVLSLFNGYISARFTSRVRCYLFPRCIHFANTDVAGLYYYYAVSERFKNLFPNVENRLDYLWFMFNINDKVFDTLPQPQKDFLLWLFGDVCDYPDKLCDWDYFHSFFYCLFHTSDHFLKVVCDGDSNRIRQRIQMIVDFYKDMELRSLLDWQRAKQEYSDLYGDICYSLFYMSDLYSDEDFEDNFLYKQIVEQKAYKMKNRVKHRELNDANGYFIINS